MAVSKDARQRQRKDEAPACFLARTAVHSSSVVQAVTGSFRRPGTEDVVLCKQTALELLYVTADGSLESVFEQSTFGSVVRLGVLPSDAASTVRTSFHEMRFAEVHPLAVKSCQGRNIVLCSVVILVKPVQAHSCFHADVFHQVCKMTRPHLGQLQDASVDVLVLLSETNISTVLFDSHLHRCGEVWCPARSSCLYSLGLP